MPSVVKEDPRVSEEQSFRSSLEDLIAIADKLSPFCESLEELVGLSKLALENDAQLRLLIAVYKQTTGVRK